MSLPSSYEKLVAIKAAESLRDSAEVQSVPLEQPGPGEILVKTHYAGVNAADYLMAIGRYIAKTNYPADLGAESAGEVVAVGEDVGTVEVGQHVLALLGGYREYFTIPAHYAIPIPQASAAAVACGVSGLTASIALEITGEMTSGETVLVTAAAGGTGSFVVQLAKLAGNTVIGTCGNDDKVAFLEDMGCDRPINYRKESLKD
ncbi:MAG: alcohol dehydrogenase catalytic domain-containing protein, partial [Aggregatilineales bacterium]